jgi:hypothetical protein
MTAGNSSESMPSFTDSPFGADRFKIIRTDPSGFVLVMMPLTFASAGRSSSLTGPVMSPFFNQTPTASVTCHPFL